MDGLTARTVAIAAIGFGIGLLVISDPRLTHDSLPVVVLAVIPMGSALLAGLVGASAVVRRVASKSAELYGAGEVFRFIGEAAFASCAALAWALGVAVTLRS